MSKSLGLINYEGDCLKLVKDNSTLHIKDQYGQIVMQNATVENVYEFVTGNVDIVDSKGKAWHFPSEHKEAVPSLFKLHEFLKDINIKICKCS
jgi:hypothetical protein